MRKTFRILSLALFAAAGFYVYAAADLYFHQAKHVYHPQKEWKATPDSEGLSYEDLTLRSSDGVKLSAWYIPSKENKGSILFCHGNSRNISSDLDAVKMFNEYGYNVFAIDYRGYGKSEGLPDEEGTYRDADAAWDWLVKTKGEKPERIVICGRSLGSAIAADIARRHLPKGLILEAAFTSLPDAGQAKYPYFPVKLLSKYHYDTLSKLPQIGCPVLIVHSRDDEIIPISQAKRLYAAIRTQKQFVEIGGPHKGGFKPTLPLYHSGVRDFLERLELNEAKK